MSKPKKSIFGWFLFIIVVVGLGYWYFSQERPVVTKKEPKSKKIEKRLASLDDQIRENIAKIEKIMAEIEPKYKKGLQKLADLKREHDVKMDELMELEETGKQKKRQEKLNNQITDIRREIADTIEMLKILEKEIIETREYERRALPLERKIDALRARQEKTK